MNKYLFYCWDFNSRRGVFCLFLIDYKGIAAVILDEESTPANTISNMFTPSVADIVAQVIIDEVKSTQ